jgi:hypothetical protein
MAMVRDWLDEFLERLCTLYRPHDWPEGHSGEWFEWRKAWVRHLLDADATAADAAAVAERLALDPPRFRADWIPAVVRGLKALRDSRDGGASSREAALSASAGCPACGGTGLVAVRHADPANVPPRCAAHCTCPYGRWARSRLAADQPHLLRRTPDLAALPAGWSTADPDVDAYERVIHACGDNPLAALRAMLAEDLAARRRELASQAPAARLRPAPSPPPPGVVAADPILSRESQRPAPGPALTGDGIRPDLL